MRTAAQKAQAQKSAEARPVMAVNYFFRCCGYFFCSSTLTATECIDEKLKYFFCRRRRKKIGLCSWGCGEKKLVFVNYPAASARSAVTVPKLDARKDIENISPNFRNKVLHSALHFFLGGGSTRFAQQRSLSILNIYFLNGHKTKSIIIFSQLEDKEQMRLLPF